MHRQKQNSGFSLVELAVVFVAVGLLIAIGMKSIQILASSKITATVIQGQAIEMSANTFSKKFGALPGDFTAAGTQLQGCGADCVPLAASAGNMVIGSPTWADNDLLASQLVGAVVPDAAGITEASETYLFWAHMVRAGMLKDIKAGAIAGDAYAFGTTHPESAVGGGLVVGHFARNGAVLGPVLAIVSFPNSVIVEPRAGGVTTPAVPAGPQDTPLTPYTAAQIDRKLDDGIPTTGIVRAYGQLAACNTGAAYNENSKLPECGIIMAMDIEGLPPAPAAAPPPQAVVPPVAEVPVCVPKLELAVTAPAPLNPGSWVKKSLTKYDLAFTQAQASWSPDRTETVTVNIAGVDTISSFKLNALYDYASTSSVIPAEIYVNGNKVYGNVEYGSVNLTGADELEGYLIDGDNTFSFVMKIPGAPPPLPPPPVNNERLCCFIRGTKVRMADGTEKNIEDIVVGDLVVTYDESTGKFGVSEVIEIFHHKEVKDTLVEFKLSNGRTLTSNTVHMIFVNGNYVEAQDIAKMVEDGQKIEMLGADGQKVTVVSCKTYEATTDLFNLHVRSVHDKDGEESNIGHNYIAEGVLVHNEKAESTVDDCEAFPSARTLECIANGGDACRDDSYPRGIFCIYPAGSC